MIPGLFVKRLVKVHKSKRLRKSCAANEIFAATEATNERKNLKLGLLVLLST